MKITPYTSRKGEQLFAPDFTHEEAAKLMLDGNMGGFCPFCKNEQTVEPDARRIKCENCGRDSVYGLEQLLLMGVATVEGEVVR